ncbi:HNH endonuclease family protein [Pseudoxanthomonas sp. UC29_72]
MKAGGESSKFPSDDELHNAIFEQNFYRLKKEKVRAVLQALDMQAASKFSEDVIAHDKLTIEHLLPQSWETHWALPEGLGELERQKAIIRRNRLLHSIGNLTLITGSFNSKQQNYGWSEKKAELIKFSKLNLTQYFHDIDRWDEDAINKRTEHLFVHMKEIWPYPG